MTVPFLLARSPVMVLLVEAILHENPKKDWVILHINSCGKQLLYAFLVEKNNTNNTTLKSPEILY